MLWNLGFIWLAIALVCVIILSFIVATMLDTLIGNEAFGAAGNAAVMTFGFFAAIYLANSLGYRLNDLARAIPVGVGGAFALFGFLVVFKGTMRRLLG